MICPPRLPGPKVLEPKIPELEVFSNEDDCVSVYNLHTFNIPFKFVVGLEDIVEDEEDDFCDNETVCVSNIPSQQVSALNKQDKYGNICAQVDTEAKVTVVNFPWVLCDIIWYKDSKKHCPVTIYSETSQDLICPETEGKVTIPADNVQGFIYVKDCYSPSFTSILLANKNMLLSALNPKNYSAQTLTIFLDVDDNKWIQDLDLFLADELDKGTAWLLTSNYNNKNGNFELECHHKCRHITDIITLFGVIHSGKCYTEPMILPNLPKDNPAATVQNSLENRWSYLLFWNKRSCY